MRRMFFEQTTNVSRYLWMRVHLKEEARKLLLLNFFGN
jgi:hypothetical protein